MTLWTQGFQSIALGGDKRSSLIGLCGVCPFSRFPSNTENWKQKSISKHLPFISFFINSQMKKKEESKLKSIFFICWMNENQNGGSVFNVHYFLVKQTIY